MTGRDEALMSSNVALRPVEHAVDFMDASGFRYLLVHEAALVSWGIDNNAFLECVDLLVDDGCFDSLGLTKPELPGEFAVMMKEDVRMRLWSKASLNLPDVFPSVDAGKCRARSLSPHLVLEKLAYSPDIATLREQVAVLAKVLYCDMMNDDELRLFLKYTRY